MKNSIIESINALQFRVKPISHKFVTQGRGDGLVQTLKEDIYSDDVKKISQDIASSKLTLTEKLELNELLNSKLPI